MALGIESVDMSHAATEVGIRCFNQQMVVITHQAVSMYFQSKSIMRFLQCFLEYLVILLSWKYSLPSSSSIHDVIISILVFQTDWAWHG
jgi:hypothetical protein